jgi:hypothetical protein
MIGKLLIHTLFFVHIFTRHIDEPKPILQNISIPKLELSIVSGSEYIHYFKLSILFYYYEYLFI